MIGPVWLYGKCGEYKHIYGLLNDLEALHGMVIARPTKKKWDDFFTEREHSICMNLVGILDHNGAFLSDI